MFFEWKYLRLDVFNRFSSILYNIRGNYRTIILWIYCMVIRIFLYEILYHCMLPRIRFFWKISILKRLSKYDDFYVPIPKVFSFVCSRISCNSSGDNWCLRSARWYIIRYKSILSDSSQTHERLFTFLLTCQSVLKITFAFSLWYKNIFG